MRIGFITGEFPPMQGGVGAFTEQLAKACMARGHEIHVISHRGAREERVSGRGRKLSDLRKPLEKEWGLLHALARHWRWSDIGKIVSVALRYDLDVLNIQYQAAAYNMRSPAINLAPWRLRGLAKTVVTFHDLRVPYLFPKAGRLREYAVRLAAQKSHGVISTNAMDRRTLEQWLGEEVPVVQIPIGSNIPYHQVTREEVAAARRKLGVPHDVLLLGYFGFLNASKGADLLIEALAQLEPDVHLMFIGGRTGTSDHKNNQAFVSEIDQRIDGPGLSARVHYTGFRPDNEISAFLEAADMLVLPYRDGVTLRRGTLMAALVHGRPVISTHPREPVEELVHGENLWLVPREDPDALADAIRYLGGHQAMRARLAQGARHLADAFDWDTIATGTLAFFEALGA